MRDFGRALHADAKINQIFGAPNQIQRLVIARPCCGLTPWRAQSRARSSTSKPPLSAVEGRHDRGHRRLDIPRSADGTDPGPGPRRGVRNLTLVPAPGSVAPDMLIGAGCVREDGLRLIGFEYLGLPLTFRRAAQSGAIKVLGWMGGHRRRPTRRRLRTVSPTG